MKKTFYKAVSFKTEIEKAEVENHDDDSVWIRGIRLKRITDYESYFETKEAALLHLVEIRRKSIKKDQERIAYFKSKIRESELEMQELKIELSK